MTWLVKTGAGGEVGGGFVTGVAVFCSLSHLETFRSVLKRYILLGRSDFRIALGMKKIIPFISVLAAVVLNAPAYAQSIPLAAPTSNIYCDTFYDTLKNSAALTIDAFLYDLTKQSRMSQSVTAKALMYNSRALHGTSFQNPRALIMYGLSDLVLAFNGHPEQHAYNLLEIMCYNRQVGEFQFRAIQFLNEKGPGAAELSEDEIEVSNSRFKMTKANPDSCKVCHSPAGSNYIRPSWQTYLAWAGTYGSYEEAYNLPSARFAQENTEYKSLMDFKQSVIDGKLRYNRFYWGGPGAPNLSTVNNAFFGILLNYKMANSALRSALKSMKSPELAKYRFAFAGYMLNCNDEKFIEGDSESALRPLRARMATERARFEIRQRLNLNNDLTEHALQDNGTADEVKWLPRNDDAYPVDTKAVNLDSYSKGFSSMVARVSRVTPKWLIKLSRFENLYDKMGLSTEPLHLGDVKTPNAKTSWDGYNEVQDYMADYLYKYYGLPAITPIQQAEGEEISARQSGVDVVHRLDLMTKLSDEDYGSVVEDLKALGLPEIQGTDKNGLCRALSAESLKALN